MLDWKILRNCDSMPPYQPVLKASDGKSGAVYGTMGSRLYILSTLCFLAISTVCADRAAAANFPTTVKWEIVLLRQLEPDETGVNATHRAPREEPHPIRKDARWTVLPWKELDPEDDRITAYLHAKGEKPQVIEIPENCLRLAETQPACFRMIVEATTELPKTLFVRCHEGHLKASVRWGSWGVLGYAQEERIGIQVRTRFDSAEPRSTVWSIAKSYDTTQAPEPEQFIAAVGSHNELEMQTFSQLHGRQTVKFDLSEAKPVIEEVTAACR